MAARRQLLAQFLARHAFRQRLGPMMLGQRPDDRVLQPREDGGGDQDVARPDRLCRADQRLRMPANAFRIDTGPRRQGGQRKPGQPRLFDHHERRAQLRFSAVVGRRIELEPPQPLERRRAANAGSRRLRIEDQAAGDRLRRRIRAQDVAVAAPEDGRRFEPQPHERAPAGGDRRDGAIRSHRPDHRDAADDLRRPLVKPHARAMLERPRARQHFDDWRRRCASRRRCRARAAPARGRSLPPRRRRG